MIVLDTNVLSEPLRSEPDHRVARWLDGQPMDTLALSTVTVAEVRFGIACLPPGRRRSALDERFEHEVLPAFEDRLLLFDEGASAAYAELRSAARSQSRAISVADAMIAATALVHSAAVATRDVAPFTAAGLEVVDPFA